METKYLDNTRTFLAASKRLNEMRAAIKQVLSILSSYIDFNTLKEGFDYYCICIEGSKDSNDRYTTGRCYWFYRSGKIRITYTGIPLYEIPYQEYYVHKDTIPIEFVRLTYDDLSSILAKIQSEREEVAQEVRQLIAYAT